VGRTKGTEETDKGGGIADAEVEADEPGAGHANNETPVAGRG